MAKKAPKPVPEGMPTLTPHLYFNGNCREAIDFYQKALGAKLMAPAMTGPDGKSIIHVMMKFGDSPVMMADAWPGHWETGPKDSTSVNMWMYVEDCDAVFKQAVEAGGEVVDEMMDAFWGDRVGKVKDPFGHTWSIATYQWVVGEEELQQRMDEWMKTLS